MCRVYLTVRRSEVGTGCLLLTSRLLFEAGTVTEGRSACSEDPLCLTWIYRQMSPCLVFYVNFRFELKSLFSKFFINCGSLDENVVVWISVEYCVFLRGRFGKEE